MNKIGLKLLGLGAILLLLCLGVDTAYRRIYNLSYEWPEHIGIDPPIEEPYEVVALGNSHAQSGLTFKGYKLKSLNLANMGQRFSYDLLMLKQQQHQIAEGAVIVINVSPISFSHRTADGNDGLQYSYFGRLSPWLIPDLHWGDWIQSELLPFVRSGYLWRKKYGEIVTDRVAAGEKRETATPSAVSEKPIEIDNSPKQEAINRYKENYYFSLEGIQATLNNPPPIKNEASYIDNMNFIFSKWYQTEEFDPKYFEMNRRDLEKLITYCREKKWRPILITVPVTWVLEEGLMDDYKQVYLYDNLAKTNLQGAEYLDFSQNQQFIKNKFLFANADHLNDRGAPILSYMLMKELISRGYIPASADGYSYETLEEILAGFED